MHVFWEFVRADKDYGNVIPKVSKKKIGNDVSDPEVSDLLVDIRAQLQKVSFLYRELTLFFFLVETKRSCNMLTIYIGLNIVAEGEEAQGHGEKRELHSKEVPKAP